jgi:Right handed beta helix region
MATLTVNPGGSIQAAIDAAAAGDTIDVGTGTYNDQFLTIEESVTLQAVGGEVKLVEDTQPPDGKAMITEGQPGLNIAINGFDISGVSVPDSNGAAVRYEGGALSLAQDYFHNNQEGILAASDPSGSITINDSEFAFNGDGSGSTHNIYVNQIGSLTVTNSYVHDAIVGHEIKSRALNTIIQNNRIFDNQGSASYSIDLPNGGNATITGNVIQQSPNTQNPFMFTYGVEGESNPGTSVSFASNTIVNDDPSGAGIFNPTGVTLGFTSNSVWGLTEAQLSTGPLNESGTVILTQRPSLDTSSLAFINPPAGGGGGGTGGGTGGGGGGHGNGHSHHPHTALTAADLLPAASTTSTLATDPTTTSGTLWDVTTAHVLAAASGSGGAWG